MTKEELAAQIWDAEINDGSRFELPPEFAAEMGCECGGEVEVTLHWSQGEAMMFTVACTTEGCDGIMNFGCDHDGVFPGV